MNYKLDTDSHVFFYEQEFYVLSNFSAFTLNWKGIRFDTSEAAYHWEKFFSVCDCDWICTCAGLQRKLLIIRDSIRLAPSAHEAFKLAERYKEYRRSDWDSIKLDIMKHILKMKVDQHEYVRKKLLETGNRTLVEDSWRDNYWGWGPDRNGKNMLGKLWMEIREELRAE